MAALFILILIITHDGIVPYLAAKYLKDFGATYTKISGTILHGIVIDDINYKDSIRAKKIHIDYNFLSLIRPNPKINFIDIENLHVNINKIPNSAENSSSFSVFGISISEIKIDNSEVIYDDKIIKFSLNASNLEYVNALHVDNLYLKNLSLKNKNQSLSILSLKTENIDFQDALKIEKIYANTIKANDINKSLTLDSLSSTNIDYEKSLHVEYLKLLTFKAKSTTSSAKFSSLEGSKIFYDEALHVRDVFLHKASVFDANQSIYFDLNSTLVKYDKTTYASDLKLNLSSSHGQIILHGDVVSDTLQADANVTLDESITNQYLSFLKESPSTLNLKLDINTTLAKISTELSKVSFDTDDNLSLENMQVNLKYFIKDGYFTADTDYKFYYQNIEALHKQTILFTPSGAFESDLNATSISASFKLPFKQLSAKLAGDTENIFVDINTEGINLSILGEHYRSFMIHAKADDINLSFIEGLPKGLQDDILSFKTDAIFNVSPFSLIGNIKAEDKNAYIDGNYELDSEGLLVMASATPKQKSQLFKDYPLYRYAPLKFTAYTSRDLDMLNLEANLLNVSLFKDENLINGWGNFNTINFDVSGNISDKTTKEITFAASFPSINTLSSDLNLKLFNNKMFQDAEANVKATLSLSDDIKIKTRIDIPWYALGVDSQTTYSGVDSFVEASLVNKNLTIDAYDVEILGQRVHSQKKSKISFDNKNSINIKEFWVYDDLLLKGLFNYKNKEGNLTLKSDKFLYDGEEGNLSVSTDIELSIDSTGKQTIEGSVTLLDGVIKYIPKNDHIITDEDIIIIQDIKDTKKLNRFVNIHLSSKKPILYKIDNIDVSFTPDVTLYQEPYDPISLLGMISAHKGEIKGAGKKFTIKPSEVYFYGANILNPYVNLNLHYVTLNYIDIEILVTNDVDSPIIIFSSDPALSQNDIMSYILFGEPASSTFASSSDSGSNKVYIGSLLLGTGLKSMLNESKYLKIDTLNILTNEDGALGYEIGSRITKDLRVVYKNDTISGVVVQYSLNKSTRFDVDVYETGQGINIIYIKDF